MTRSFIFFRVRLIISCQISDRQKKIHLADVMKSSSGREVECKRNSFRISATFLTRLSEWNRCTRVIALQFIAKVGAETSR